MAIQKYCMWNFSLLISKQWLLRLHFSYFLIKLFFPAVESTAGWMPQKGFKKLNTFLWTWEVWVYIFSFVSAWVCFLHNKSLGKPWQIAKNIPSGQKSQGSISWFQHTQCDQQQCRSAGTGAAAISGAWGAARAGDAAGTALSISWCARAHGDATRLWLPNPWRVQGLAGCGLEHLDTVPGVPALDKVLQLGEFKVLSNPNCCRSPC